MTHHRLIVVETSQLSIRAPAGFLTEAFGSRCLPRRRQRLRHETGDAIPGLLSESAAALLPEPRSQRAAFDAFTVSEPRHLASEAPRPVRQPAFLDHGASPTAACRLSDSLKATMPAALATPGSAADPAPYRAKLGPASALARRSCPGQAPGRCVVHQPRTGDCHPAFACPRSGASSAHAAAIQVVGKGALAPARSKVPRASLAAAARARSACSPRGSQPKATRPGAFDGHNRPRTSCHRRPQALRSITPGCIRWSRIEPSAATTASPSRDLIQMTHHRRALIRPRWKHPHNYPLRLRRRAIPRAALLGRFPAS